MGSHSVIPSTIPKKITFKINDEHLNGSFKNVFEKTSRDFSQDKGFVMKAGDYLVFEK